MKRLLLIFLYILAGCSSHRGNTAKTISQKNTPGILKGDIVVETSSMRPYVVAVYTTDINDWSRSTCTGTFISDSAVLTAAHCIGQDANKVHQVIYDLSPAENMKSGNALIQLAITSITIHEKYIPNSHIHDIAIIKFKGGLPAGAKAASLAKSFHPEIPVTIAGYGDSQEEQQHYSGHGILRTLNVAMEVFPENVFGVVDQYKNKLVIMDQENGGGCFGDSGGPALQLDAGKVYQLVGVNAFVAGGLTTANPLCHGTGAYTNVEFYKEWIEAHK